MGFNMKRIAVVIVVCVLIAVVNVYAQKTTTTIAPTKEYATKAKWDTAYINKMLVECDVVRLYNVQQAKQLAFKCLKSSRELNCLKGCYESNNMLSLIYSTLGYSDTCFYYNFRALTIAKKISPEFEVNSYINIANEHVKLFEMDSAIFYCNKASSFKKGISKSNQVKIKNCLFIIYFFQEKLDETNALGNDLLKEYPTINNNSLYARFLHSLTVYYMRTKDERYEQTLLKGISQALLAKDSSILFSFYQTQGIGFFYESKFNLAREKIKTSLSFFKLFKSDNYLSTSYFYLYMLERRSKNFSIAKCYLDSSYAVNPRKKVGNTTKDDFVYTTTFADLYTDAGNYKQANQYLKRAIAIQDSLQVKLNNKTILEFQTKYETQLKENRIQVQQLQLSKQSQTRNFILLFFCTLIALGIFLYFKNKKMQQRKRELEKLKAKNELFAVQQQLLRTQMTPHFIFNAVDAIQGLISSNNNEAAITYLNKFAKLTRQILQNSTESHITLAEEISMLHNYLGIQQLLYNNKFVYTLTVDEAIDSEQLLVPPMLTQPFVENAIKHGFKNKTEGGVVIISFDMRNDALVFTLTDNGEGLPTENKSDRGHKSLATKIVNERLNNANNVPVTYNLLHNGIVQGTETKLQIPYIYDI
jgi:sensor histidine kinase YesM